MQPIVRGGLLGLVSLGPMWGAGQAGALRTDMSKALVPLDEIVPGGPAPDGIPAIGRPIFVATGAADAWLRPREPVLALQLIGDGLTVLLVGIAEPRDTVARVVAARGYTARVLLDPDGRAGDAYSVRGTPTVYLIGPDGILLGRAIGPRPWAQPSRRALLAALLRLASLFCTMRRAGSGSI